LKKSLILFIAGIIFGVLITDLEALGDPNHPNEILDFFVFSLNFGGFLANFSYYVILIIILPFVVLPDLKKTLGSRALSLYVFVAGVTFWGAVDGLYIMLSL